MRPLPGPPAVTPPESPATRYVALLRGINVGTAKRVAMADLRALVEGLGFRGATTLLNSGNVVFDGAPTDGADAAARIEAALLARTGVSARVLVIRATDLATIVADNPLPEADVDPSRFLVAFLFDPAEAPRLAPLVDRDWGTERVAIGARAAYLWCPDGVLRSHGPDAVAKALGAPTTARSWATVTKLLALTARTTPAPRSG